MILATCRRNVVQDQKAKREGGAKSKRWGARQFFHRRNEGGNGNDVGGN